MNIVIATPLYPPETSPVAVYAKELAQRLSSNHTVTVLAYTHLAEPTKGVRVVEVDKRHPLLVRLIAFAFALKRLPAHDILYLINGASTELPTLLFGGIQAPIVFSKSDVVALKCSSRSRILRTITKWIAKKARAEVDDIAPPKPEILPLEPYPDATLRAWEESWKTHISLLEKIFEHVRH